MNTHATSLNGQTKKSSGENSSIEPSKQARNDFMFYEDYYNAISDVRELCGIEEAGKLLLEIIHYGVLRKRSDIELHYIAECQMRSIIPLLDKSKANKERTEKRLKEERKRNALNANKEKSESETDDHGA